MKYNTMKKDNILLAEAYQSIYEADQSDVFRKAENVFAKAQPNDLEEVKNFFPSFKQALISLDRDQRLEALERALFYAQPEIDKAVVGELRKDQDSSLRMLASDYIERNRVELKGAESLNIQQPQAQLRPGLTGKDMGTTSSWRHD